MDADFDAAVLGSALPPAVEQALREAGAQCGDPEPRHGRADASAGHRSRASCRTDRLLPPPLLRPSGLVLARQVARRALLVGAQALGLPALWREVPRKALAGARDDPRTRFYLHVLKGYAYPEPAPGRPGRGARCFGAAEGAGPGGPGSVPRCWKVCACAPWCRPTRTSRALTCRFLALPPGSRPMADINRRRRHAGDRAAAALRDGRAAWSAAAWSATTAPTTAMTSATCWCTRGRWASCAR